MKRCKDCYWQDICFEKWQAFDWGFKADLVRDNKTPDDCSQYKRKWWKFRRAK